MWIAKLGEVRRKDAGLNLTTHIYNFVKLKYHLKTIYFKASQLK